MTRLLIYLLIGALLAPLIMLVADAEPAPARQPHDEEPAADPPAPFALELSVDSDVIEAGTSPRFAAVLRSASDDTILLVGALDGSDSSMRYPKMPVHLTFDGATNEHRVALRACGVIDPLRVDDFVELEPGETLDVFDRERGFVRNVHLDGELSAEGDYVFQLSYDASSQDLKRWTGFIGFNPPDDDLVALFERVPKVKVRSNKVTVRVVPEGSLPDLQ